MSTAIAKNFQVGSDSTATNNFTIRQPATPDGTVRIANGNSGTTTDLVTVTSAGNVGVGTSTPLTKLHLSDAGSVFVQMTDQGDGASRIGQNGTALTFGVDTSNGATERMRLDSSGNLGLGVTPSAWASQPAIQQTGGALWGINAANYEVLQNAFYNGTNYIYRNTNLASRYNQNAGVHSWFTAPSGTAGSAITFSQVMTLDASGNLGVGETSPGFRIDIKGSSFSSFLQAQNSTSTHKAIYGVDSGGGVDGAVAGSFSNHAFILRTNNTERARITSGGDVGIGTSSPGAKLEVNGSLRASSALNTAGMFIVASGSFNNGSVNNIGVFSESHIIIHIATGSNKLSSIPVYPNGGAGIAYVYNYMNPATAAWTNTGGGDLNFTFSCAGSSANTYNVILTAGGGVLTVQRTAGSAAYAVYVQRIASL